MRVGVHLGIHASTYDDTPVCLRVSTRTPLCAFALVSACAHVCVRHVVASVRVSPSVRSSCPRVCTHVSFFVHSLGQSRGTRRFEVAGEVAAKPGRAQLPAWARSCPLPTDPVCSDPESLGTSHAAKSRSVGRDASRVPAASTFARPAAYFLPFPP